MASSGSESNRPQFVEHDDHNASTFSVVSPNIPRRGSPLPKRTINTGPKGVRADAWAYEQSKREAATARKSLQKAQLAIQSGAYGKGLENSEEYQNEVEEEKWMSRWREKRMKELSKAGVNGVNLFGQVEDVDANGYLEAVDWDGLDGKVRAEKGSRNISTRADVVVVVLTKDSKSLFTTFSHLARRHPTLHFLRLPSHEAEDNLSPSSIPAILAYRGGDLVANLVSVVDEIPTGKLINVESVETVLKQAGVFQYDGADIDFDELTL